MRQGRCRHSRRWLSLGKRKPALDKKPRLHSVLPGLPGETNLSTWLSRTIRTGHAQSCQDTLVGAITRPGCAPVPSLPTQTLSWNLHCSTGFTYINLNDLYNHRPALILILQMTKGRWFNNLPGGTQPQSSQAGLQARSDQRQPCLSLHAVAREDTPVRPALLCPRAQGAPCGKVKVAGRTLAEVR